MITADTITESTHPSGTCPADGCRQPCGRCAARVALTDELLACEKRIAQISRLLLDINLGLTNADR